MAAEDTPISPRVAHQPSGDDLLRRRAQLAIVYWAGRHLTGPQYSRELAHLDQARQSALDIVACPAASVPLSQRCIAENYLADSLPGVLALEELIHLFGGRQPEATQ